MHRSLYLLLACCLKLDITMSGHGRLYLLIKLVNTQLKDLHNWIASYALMSINSRQLPSRMVVVSRHECDAFLYYLKFQLSNTNCEDRWIKLCLYPKMSTLDLLHRIPSIWKKCIPHNVSSTFTPLLLFNWRHFKNAFSES